MNTLKNLIIPRFRDLQPEINSSCGVVVCREILQIASKPGLPTRPMLQKLLGYAVALILIAGLTAPPAAATPINVDLELVLAVDVSGSVNQARFELQRDGWANAFRTTDVQNAISGGPLGQIAATLIYWSSANSQVHSVDWTLVGDGTGSTISASAFGDLIAVAPRPFGGSTAVGSAIAYSVNSIANNDFLSTRKVIDISGDGSRNAGIAMPAAVQLAIDAGITVNGLAIEEVTNFSLTDWYANNAITPDGFVLTAETFADIEAAAIQKLVTEIRPDPVPPTDVPEPATGLLVMLGGLLGALSLRRRGAPMAS